MKEKLVKIPLAIQVAIARYYIHRSQQYDINTHCISQPNGKFETAMTVVLSGLKWDKTADEQNVFDAARKFGYHNMHSICGTFWLHKNNRSYQIGESTWPLAKSSKLVEEEA